MASFKLDLNRPEDIPLNVCMNIVLRGQYKYFSQRLSDVDINPAEIPILVHLYLKSGVTQRCITKSLYLTESSVAKSLKKLENKDMVYREVDSDKKNRKLVFLTSKGRQITSNILYLGEEWENFIVKDLSAEEMKVLKKLLYDLCMKSAEFINEE